MDGMSVDLFDFTVFSLARSHLWCCPLQYCDCVLIQRFLRKWASEYNDFFTFSSDLVTFFFFTHDIFFFLDKTSTVVDFYTPNLIVFFHLFFLIVYEEKRPYDESWT